MSTSEQSSQRQQIYYQSRTPNISQRVSLVGTSAASPVMLNSPQVRGSNQVVVVSGDNQFRSIPIGSVGYHPPGCACPNCETKFEPTIGHSSLDNRHELYTYITNDPNDDEDGIVQEFTTGNGERHVVIMTKNDANLSIQEKLRRQKLSEAARNRYALLSDDEKRIFTERRIVMRQRRKQKEREMEELEAILRATNDITDDLVLLDEQSLQRKRARLSRYQTMSIDERREYNQKRRLKQLGLPENIEEVPRQKLEQIKKHINEVNARKAEAARQRYHRMRRVEEEKLLSTPAGQITPEALEKAQSIMLRNAKRAEQARLRYQRKQQERGVVPRRQRKPKTENINESAEPNLDQILDTIERDVVRKTEEARQTLLKMQQNELKKEEPIELLDDKHHHFVVPDRGTHIVQSPLNITQQQLSGGNVVQYIQVPARGVQNGFILSDNKFVQVHTDGGVQSSGPQSYTVIQEASTSKFEGGPSSSYYPVSIIQHEPAQHHRHTTSIDHHHINQPTRIEIVQPTIITTNTSNFGQQHISTASVSSSLPSSSSSSSRHHYNNPLHQQQYTIPKTEHPIIARRSTSSNVSSPSKRFMDPIASNDQKSLLQKAKRAERARRRYHEMSAEARHEFNAKRALSLKMARMRDEELCRLGDDMNAKGQEPDENLRSAIEQARIRRSKRAEAARVKYQKMTSEQRKAHNAMRDAQRRQRKRELEDTVTVVKQ
uniref:BZIP domain-containing protein n=1 Tax=Meloidogyne hapla TaxID=6305 RepID=A0A1I8BSU6_MELHA